MALTEHSPRPYTPMEKFRATAHAFRARTPRDQGGCPSCDGYGLHLHRLPTLVTCTDCTGTGRTR